MVCTLQMDQATYGSLNSVGADQFAKMETK